MTHFLHVLESYNFLHLAVAGILGALIGLERELAGKDPSLRTFALISLGACLFSMVSVYSVEGHIHGDPSRIAAQIVTGIGFLGAGAIYRSPKGINGLTTAALMWVTAAIGMSVGFDRIDLALSATVVALTVAVSLSIVHRILKLWRPEEKDGGGNGGIE